jgi:integrase
MKQRVKEYLRPHDYLEGDQVRAVLDYIRRKARIAEDRGSRRAIMDKMLIELLISTGLRAAELCALKLSDLPGYHGKKAIYVRRGKGSKPRTIEISTALVVKLRQYTRAQRKWAKPRSWLFINERGQRLRYWSLYRKVKRIGKAVGLPFLHPHCFRHTYSVHLREIEGDQFFLKDQLGHKSLDTTMIYSKTRNPARRRQIEQLDRGWNKP